MKTFTARDIYSFLSNKDGIVHITDGDYTIRMNKADFDMYFSGLDKSSTLNDTIEEYKGYEEQHKCHELFNEHKEYFKFLVENHDKNIAKF